MPSNDTGVERVPARRQTFRVIAQDPAVHLKGKLLTADVEVPAEILAPGPWGHRVHVIDYDASTDTFYKPHRYEVNSGGLMKDPFAKASDDQLLNDPRFHAQNAYSIVMRILARFEYALGRRVRWSFDGHQLKVVPHAFADSNAFYSRADEALLFGYFTGKRSKTVLTCLSHDIVAHETTHALVDGLRARYTAPSSSDQAAFHEGFSDVIALLSVFAVPNVVKALLDIKWSEGNGRTPAQERVKADFVSPEGLRQSALFGLAEQMGDELEEVRGVPLRHSVVRKPSPTYYQSDPEYREPHKRGEILVAAMMNSLVAVWSQRLQELRRDALWTVDRDRVAEEGAAAADCLLTMSIRALDYCPPVHLDFKDFLSALLTADYEIRPKDNYGFRKHLRETFASYGINPASDRKETEAGLWMPPTHKGRRVKLSSARCHFEPLQRDADEVFRFIWENRKFLEIVEEVYTRVESVRPCVRVADDGFVLRETVAEYVQILSLPARELKSFKGLKRPEGVDPDKEIWLYGGGVLIFDEYGQVKFHIHNHIDSRERQNQRLQDLADHGYFAEGASLHRRFSQMHRNRAMNLGRRPQEEWI